MFLVTGETLEFFQGLGFDEIEIEDGLTAYFIETGADESYALVTDDNGESPANLRKPLIFACYSPEGAFLWSASFKNAFLFKETWQQSEAISDKLAAIQNYRQNNETF